MKHLTFLEITLRLKIGLTLLTMLSALSPVAAERSIFNQAPAALFATTLHTLELVAPTSDFS